MESSERYWPDWNHGSRALNGPTSTRFLIRRLGSIRKDGKKLRNARRARTNRKRGRQMQQSNATNKDLIIGWLSRLASHFNYAVTEDQIDIFVKALAKDRAGKI